MSFPRRALLDESRVEGTGMKKLILIFATLALVACKPRTNAIVAESSEKPNASSDISNTLATVAKEYEYYPGFSDAINLLASAQQMNFFESKLPEAYQDMQEQVEDVKRRSVVSMVLAIVAAPLVVASAGTLGVATTSTAAASTVLGNGVSAVASANVLGASLIFASDLLLKPPSDKLWTDTVNLQNRLLRELKTRRSNLLNGPVRIRRNVATILNSFFKKQASIQLTAEKDSTRVGYYYLLKPLLLDPPVSSGNCESLGSPILGESDHAKMESTLENAEGTCLKYYGAVSAYFGNAVTPKIKLAGSALPSKEMAITQGTLIVFQINSLMSHFSNEGHVKSGPLIHEMVHAFQSQFAAKTADWYLEGTADLIRHQIMKEDSVCAVGETYKTGYGCAAAMLQFGIDKYLHGDAKKMILAVKQSASSEPEGTFFKSTFGGTADNLFADCGKLPNGCRISR